jgi:NAD(P)-dependent dehydrogenase (short-subunit alcohol dehydrogenase family)
MTSLRGKSAVVTGGSSGVGKVASAILTALRGGVPAGVNAIAVRGTGTEPLT